MQEEPEQAEAESAALALPSPDSPEILAAEIQVDPLGLELFHAPGGGIAIGGDLRHLGIRRSHLFLGDRPLEFQPAEVVEEGAGAGRQFVGFLL